MKVSIQGGANQMNLGHNTRDPKMIEREHDKAHIDPDGIHETWVNVDLREAYQEQFGDAIKENNQKAERQRHPERIMTIDDYMAKMSLDKRQGKNDGKRTPNLVYEMVVQVGNNDQQPTEEDCRKLLKEFLQDFQENNPNMCVVGAFYHADEATPHLHLDYFPVAHGFARGMSTRNSLNKALEEQGFGNVEKRIKMENGVKLWDTAQIRWENQQRIRLAQICKSHGINIDLNSKEHREHQEQTAFRAKQNTEKAIDNYNFMEKELSKVTKEVEILNKFKGLKQDVPTLVSQEKEIDDLHRKISALYEKIESLSGKCTILDEQKRKMFTQNNQLRDEIRKGKDILQVASRYKHAAETLKLSNGKSLDEIIMEKLKGSRGQKRVKESELER